MKFGRYKKSRSYPDGSECYTNKRLYYDPAGKMFWIASDETFSNFKVLDGIDISTEPKKQLCMVEYTYEIPSSYKEITWDSIMSLAGIVQQIHDMNSVERPRAERYKLYFDGKKFYVGFFTSPRKHEKQWYCFTPQMPFLENEKARGYMSYSEPKKEELVNLETMERLFEELAKDKEKRS